MTEPIAAEGATLSEALSQAASLLGVEGPLDLSFDYDREHFRQGAYTVRILVSPQSAEDLEARQAHKDLAEAARSWMAQVLTLFGTDAQVQASGGQRGEILVSVACPDDGRLLIGKGGQNLEAFEALLKASMARSHGTAAVSLDIENYKTRGPLGRDGDRRGGRDGEHRSRGRDGGGGGRDGGGGGRDGGGRGRDGGGRGRDGGGRGRDGGGRRDRGPRPDDEERKARIKKQTLAAINRVLDGTGPIELDNLNSYERHLAHSFVKEEAGVRSRSVGDGADKRVEIYAE